MVDEAYRENEPLCALLCRSRSQAAAQCDSDRTDVRDIMVKASVLTGNSVFRFGGYEALDLESLWLFGRKGAERYEAAVSREPERWTIMPRIQVISIYGAAGKRTQTTHTFPAALREAVMVMGI